MLNSSVTARVLKLIQETIEATRIQMTDEEALLLWPKVKLFVKTNGREPVLHAADPLEGRMAESIAYLKHKRREQGL